MCGIRFAFFSSLARSLSRSSSLLLYPLNLAFCCSLILFEPPLSRPVLSKQLKKVFSALKISPRKDGIFDLSPLCLMARFF